MKLFFRKFGSGPPLLILHGLYGSSDNWVTIAKLLSGKFTAFLPDLRNHGQSPHSTVYDYDSLSQDILELTKEVNIEKFVLAGHSMGGKIAVNFARRWPEKIISLVIMDISPFAKEDPEKKFYREHKVILESIKSIDLTSITKRSDAERILSEKLDSERTRGLVLKNLSRSIDNTFSWKIDADSLYNNLENIIAGLPEPNPKEAITGFPVLFIKGELSEHLSVGDMKTVKLLFPAAEMISIKNAGHWLHADRPDAIAEIFLTLL